MIKALEHFVLVKKSIQNDWRPEMYACWASSDCIPLPEASISASTSPALLTSDKNDDIDIGVAMDGFDSSSYRRCPQTYGVHILTLTDQFTLQYAFLLWGP